MIDCLIHLCIKEDASECGTILVLTGGRRKPCSSKLAFMICPVKTLLSNLEAWSGKRVVYNRQSLPLGLRVCTKLQHLPRYFHKAGVALYIEVLVVQGIIQHATINNMAFGRSVDETIRTLQAIQYVQENPDEVCPAGWKPGEVTMKPDPKGSKEYFSAL